MSSYYLPLIFAILLLLFFTFHFTALTFLIILSPRTITILFFVVCSKVRF